MIAVIKSITVWKPVCRSICILSNVIRSIVEETSVSSTVLVSFNVEVTARTDSHSKTSSSGKLYASRSGHPSFVYRIDFSFESGI